MHDDLKIDPAQLKHLRDTRAWSQEQLAEIAGLNTRTVQRVEASGKAAQETCMALASALGVPASALMTQPVDVSTAASALSSLTGDAVTSILRRIFRVLMLLVLMLFVLVVMFQLWFGIQAGKDMAERDNARACVPSHDTRCD
jgi:transcriptional regulator with XRE-family HTH domain